MRGTWSAIVAEFTKIFKDSINFILVRNNSRTSTLPEIYNATCSFDSIYQNCSFSVIVYNYSAYNLYKKNQKYFGEYEIKNETCHDKINRLLSHVYSNITAPSRFGNNYRLSNLIFESKYFHSISVTVFIITLKCIYSLNCFF